MKKPVILLLLLLVVARPAFSQQAPPMAEDPVLEARLNKLSKELRCLVCQNETLADSQASLADDLRREIREQMKAGKSDKEIINYLTQRYGDFILYRPQVTPTNYLLWFGPFIFLIAGLVILFKYIRQRRDTIGETPLSDAERERAKQLLGGSSEEGA